MLSTLSAIDALQVTKVEDPSKYGVVVANDDGRISDFVEKPKGESCNLVVFCVGGATMRC